MCGGGMVNHQFEPHITDLGMNIYKINVPNSPTTPIAAVALW